MTPSSTRPTLAVVGATGAVGSVLLALLSTRRDVWGEVRLVASRRSAGRALTVRGQELVVAELTAGAFDDVDVAVFATPAEVSAHWAPPVAARGTVVVDVSAAFRTDPQVPLVAPGVNPARLRDRPRGIVALPSCTTSSVIDVLAPLHRRWELDGLVLTSCMAASAAGRVGVERFYDELAVVSSTRTLGQRSGDVRAALQAALPGSTSPFPGPLALNVVPFTGPRAVGEAGWSAEEVAVRQEVRRLLGAPALPVSVTCMQVPVVTSHSVVVHASFVKPITAADARRAIIEAPSVVLLDGDGAGGEGGDGAGDGGDLPTPADAVGSDPAWAGRVRQALDCPRTVEMVICSDNLRRGSALAAAEIGELLTAELAP